MSDIAILKTGGKQYLVKAGDILKVEKLAESKNTLEFSDLLAGKKITASIKGQGRGEKLHIRKYKAKTNYRRHMGHRQSYTELTIEKIA